MSRKFVISAALLGALGVALGAFGAHGLASTLEANDRTATFETATRYHMYHALALLGTAWLATQYPGRWVNTGGVLLIGGTVIFSGSLYLLALTDTGFWGAIAPVGGALLIAGWACLGRGAWRNQI